MPEIEQFGRNEGAVGRIVRETAMRSKHGVSAVKSFRPFVREPKGLTVQHYPFIAPPRRIAYRFIKRFAQLSTRGPWMQAPLIEVHNRPRVAIELRRAGYSGVIALRMHNELGPEFHNSNLGEKLVAAVDAFIVVSSSVERTLPDLALHSKRFVLPGGVDCHKFRPEEPRQRSSGRLKLISVGRITPEKGQLTLVQAFLENTQLRQSCTLTIVGGAWFGSRHRSSHEEQILQIANQVNALSPSTILITGHVDHSQLAQKLANADAFVSAATWREPFGLVFVEALAAGIPVVAYDTGGISEAVGPGALLVPVGNTAELVNGIYSIEGNTELRQSLATAGRIYVEARYDWSQVVDKWDALMANLWQP